MHPQSDVDTDSDAQLLARVAATVQEPRDRPADSFVLHAPLELAARAALLRWVDEPRREAARARIVDIATQWEAFAPSVSAPRSVPDNLESATNQLVAALAAGDAEAADGAALALGRLGALGELASRVGDAILTSTAAAGHAPIFLYQMPRVAPRRELPGELLRPLARELSRFPDWRIGWVDHWRASPDGDARAFFDALLDTPCLGPGDSDFVHPTMMRVDGSGIAADVVGATIPPSDPTGAARAMLRVAALSMLHEPDTHAAYGWSHCLTMPQAVLGIAPHLRDPARALAVAATFVVGFRASEGSGPVPAVYAPRRPDGIESGGWREALGAGSKVAAAAVWHAPEAERMAIWSELAARAATHPDAHLAKYTLACLDAAEFDRGAAALYLAAAANLVAVWSA